MGTPALFFLVLLITANCSKYDEAAKEMLSLFDSMVDTPLSKDIGKLHRFKDDLAEFSRKMIPVAEAFTESVEKNITYTDITYNLTDRIQKKAHKYFSYSSDYGDIQSQIKMFLYRISFAAWNNEMDIEILKNQCLREHGTMEMQMEDLIGRECLKQSFSPKTASIIFAIIESFKYRSYTLSTFKHMLIQNDQDKFTELFAGLYFYLERNKDVDLSDYRIRKFMKENKDVIYENKASMLEDLLPVFGINRRRLPSSNCLPLSVFVGDHFNRHHLLLVADAVMRDIYTIKFITHMCANISSFGNPKAAEFYVTSADEILSPVYSVLAHWYDYLLESTWPKTESDLIRGLMSEASEGRGVNDTTHEYQRIANFVHEKMIPIGHPRYNRQYLTTKEYSLTLNNPNFDFKCKENGCSRAVSGGAQCLIMRSPKAKVGNETIEYQNFANFTERLKPKIMKALQKDYDNVPQVAIQLHNFNVSLTEFINHSSYVALHKSRYFGNCSIFYGYKSEGEDETTSLRLFRHDAETKFFSKCRNWLLFLGL